MTSGGKGIFWGERDFLGGKGIFLGKGDFLGEKGPSEQKHFGQALMCSSEVPYLIQEVSGLHQLWPQGVEGHIWGLQLPVVPLWEGSIAFPNGVIEGMETNGIFHISYQHLGTRAARDTHT